MSGRKGTIPHYFKQKGSQKRSGSGQHRIREQALRQRVERELSNSAVVAVDVDGDNRPDLAIVPLDAVGAAAMEVDGPALLEAPGSSNFLPRLKSSMAYSSRKQFAPLAATTSSRNGPGRQGITIRGRDYVTNVSCLGASVAFDAPYYKLISPADTSIFRWFGNLAKLFETYKFLDMKFVYEPQVSASQTGAVAMYFDPDPTAVKAADWGAVCDRGVNVHGAMWAKHVLNVPQMLCASRREYYIRTNYPAIGIQGNFAYDPLEYFPGNLGIVTEGSGATTAGVVGKVYVEYTVMLGKANESVEASTLLSGAYFTPPENQGGKSLTFQRKIITGGTPANQVLIGPNAADNLANNQMDIFGWQILTPIPQTTEYITTTDVQFKIFVSLSSLTGNFTANCLEIGATDVAGNVYTYASSAPLTVAGIVVAQRNFDSGVNTTAYSALFSVKLKKDQRLAFKMSGTPGCTAWYNVSPSYTIRILSGPYEA